MLRLLPYCLTLPLLFSLLVSGQSSNLPAPVEDAFLQQFNGIFTAANKKKVAHENRIRMEWALGEQFLKLDLKVNFFEATAYIRKMPKGLYKMHWFDSFGTPTLFTAHKDPQGGQKQTLSFTPETPESSFLSRLTLRSTTKTLEVVFETTSQGVTRRSVYHRPAPSGPNKICPVMQGMDSDPHIFIDYKGQRIFFCCEECLDLFNSQPKMYLPNLPTKR
ncbi:MAG: YHS domain-containing protein [Planctomycetota bacterium]|jgi:hypothetical protein|nr:YHS domain-containing protein [Planctomycetota bacterium]